MKHREIKFEVWDTHLKTMQKDAHLYHEFIRYLSDDRYIKRQYTGLKDKKGKEIYDGDIVKYTTINSALVNEECIAYIDWCTWSFALFKKYKGERNYFTILDKICSNKIEVIGNIYQDKHLINNYDYSETRK